MRGLRLRRRPRSGPGHRHLGRRDARLPRADFGVDLDRCRSGSRAGARLHGRCGTIAAAAPVMAPCCMTFTEGDVEHLSEIRRNILRKGTGPAGADTDLRSVYRAIPYLERKREDGRGEARHPHHRAPAIRSCKGLRQRSWVGRIVGGAWRSGRRSTTCIAHHESNGISRNSSCSRGCTTSKPTRRRDCPRGHDTSASAQVPELAAVPEEPCVAAEEGVRSRTCPNSTRRKRPNCWRRGQLADRLGIATARTNKRVANAASIAYPQRRRPNGGHQRQGRLEGMHSRHWC